MHGNVSPTAAYLDSTVSLRSLVEQEAKSEIRAFSKRNVCEFCWKHTDWRVNAVNAMHPNKGTV